MPTAEDIEHWRAELDRLDAEGKFGEIVASVRSMMNRAPRDTNVVATTSPRLIDAGTSLDDIALVSEGRRLTEALLRHASDCKTRVIHEYNLSNAFGAEYHIYQKNDEADKARESLLAQRKLLQELLLRERSLSLDLRIKVHTNCANALDETGRSIEAIDHYIEAWHLDPDHMLAKGNCGVALARLASVSRNYRLHNLAGAFALLEEATANPRKILTYAPPGAVAHLIDKRDEVRTRLEGALKGGLPRFETWRTHRQEVHGQPPAPDWLQSLINDRVLLTLNQLPLASRDETVDDLYFNTLYSGIDSESEQYALGQIYLLNAIKEEFAAARYLYYQAVSPQSPGELEAVNKITTYADPGTLAEFGLAIGLLKTGFRTSVDILDKIAFFLNAYLKLGHANRKIYFSTVWYKHSDARKREELPAITAIKERNNWLRALSDLQDDWFADRFPGPFRELRHTGTHRGLVLFSETEDQEAPSVKTVADYKIATLLMLRSAKAAITYLFLLIDAEERERVRAAKGKTGTRSLKLRPGGKQDE